MVFLGIVLPIDGIPGLRRRVATASRYLSDSGVAMSCFFGLCGKVGPLRRAVFSD